MNVQRILDALGTARAPRMAVIGDFCLDEYLEIDASRDETSLETGLTAYQVTGERLYPGGAGCVAANLRALGAEVACVGVVGDDGHGYELLRALRALGADTGGMVRARDRVTSAYTKPMRRENGRETEMNRLDRRNFTRTPEPIERALLDNLEAVIHRVDGVMIQDQFVEDDLSAVTRRVREGIAEIARAHPELVFFADSRSHIRRFRDVIVKCNRGELAEALGLDPACDGRELARRAEALSARNGRPVFVTMGEQGQIACDGEARVVEAFVYDGEIDIVGAGDACGAGTAFALTLGLTAEEAALVGNAASSLAIRQIGVTGTASIAGIRALIREKFTIS